MMDPISDQELVVTENFDPLPVEELSSPRPPT